MSLRYKVTELNESPLFQSLTIQSASVSRFHGFLLYANAIFPPFCVCMCVWKREKEWGSGGE